MASLPAERRRVLMGRGALLAVLLIFLAMAVAYTRITPFGQAVDEQSHLGYASLIEQHLQLPGATTPEKQQPPLYYLLAAGVLRAGGGVEGARLLSTLCVAGAVLAVYATARRLLPRRPLLAAAAAGLFALLPEVQFVAGSVTDDGLAWLAGALTLLMVTDLLVRERVHIRVLLLAGAVAGIALLSKQTVWPLTVLLLVTAVVRCRRGERLVGSGALLLPVLAIAGWWFARNLATFHALTPPLSPITTQRQMLHSLSQLRGFLSATALSTVGMYGDGRHLTAITVAGVRELPSIVPELVIGGALLCVAVAVARCWSGFSALQRRLVVVLGIACLLVALQFVANAVLIDLQPQARYLLVAAAAVMPALTWAAWRLAGRALPLLVPAALGVALVLDVSGLISASRLTA